MIDTIRDSDAAWIFEADRTQTSEINAWLSNAVWLGYSHRLMYFNPFTADPVKALYFAILV